MPCVRGFSGAGASRLATPPRGHRVTITQKVVSVAVALPLLLGSPGAIDVAQVTQCSGEIAHTVPQLGIIGSRTTGIIQRFICAHVVIT